MGILGFYGKWIAKYIESAIMNSAPERVSSISIDMNGLIHAAKSKVIPDPVEIDDRALREKLAKRTREEIESDIMYTLDKMILDILNSFSPMECLVMAVDGVAPVAKMQQQKVRRTRAAVDRIFEPTFDSNCITPGTDFMERLDKHISNFIALNRKSLPPTVIYSSHMVNGEGEHKIMEYFRDGKIKGDDAHIVVGLDADLLVLCTMLKKDKMYVCRESSSEIVSIDNIKKYLDDRLGENSDGFTILSYFLGNDFLPKPPVFNDMGSSIEFLIDTLSFMKSKMLNEEGEINWDSLVEFIEAIADKEPTFLAESSSIDFKYPSVFIKNSITGDTFSYTKYRDLWYNNIFKPKNGKLANKINELTGVNIVPNTDTYPEKKGDMCLAYIRTIYWMWVYYRYGHKYVNIDWFYPYYYTPLLKDIKNVCVQISSEDINSYTDSCARFGKQNDYTCLHQLLAVIPVESENILPDSIRDLTKFNSPIRDQFVSNFIIEKNGINYDHEGICIIPFINMQKITLGLSQQQFSAKKIEKYLPQNDIVLVMTDENARLYKDRLVKKLKYKANASAKFRGNEHTKKHGNFTSDEPKIFIHKYIKNTKHNDETESVQRKVFKPKQYDSEEINIFSPLQYDTDIKRKEFKPKQSDSNQRKMFEPKQSVSDQRKMYKPKQVDSNQRKMYKPKQSESDQTKTIKPIQSNTNTREASSKFPTNKVYRIKSNNNAVSNEVLPTTASEDIVVNKKPNSPKQLKNSDILSDESRLELKRKEISDLMPTTLNNDLPILVDTRKKTKTASFIPVSLRNNTAPKVEKSPQKKISPKADDQKISSNTSPRKNISSRLVVPKKPTKENDEFLM